MRSWQQSRSTVKSIIDVQDTRELFPDNLHPMIKQWRSATSDGCKSCALNATLALTNLYRELAERLL